MIENDDLLKNISYYLGLNQPWYNKELDTEPVYNNFFLITKEKSHHDEATDFSDKKIFKVDSNHTCLAVISFYTWNLLPTNTFKRV